MTDKNLNDCLSKLDSIIILIDLDCDVIVNDLEYIRSYIIDLSKVEKSKNKNEIFKNTIMVMIQFINYLIDINIGGSMYGTLPSTYFDQINALRTFILRFHCGDDFIIGEKINFNEECENFIKVYISKYM